MSKLNFQDMIFSRASRAWCPITGRSFEDDVPRVVEDLAFVVKEKPTIYHRFSNSQGHTAYNHDHACYHRVDTTDYLDDLLDNFASSVPGIVRSSIGTSYEGRTLEHFLLGAVNRPIFQINSVIHGNEVDGLAGTIKGMEIICTHPDFAPLRSLYTLSFLPCCNPDGYYNYTRGVSKYGPNPSGIDQLINLNRVWPWFWTEFVPSDSESKGNIPLDCPEAQAMYDWRVTGNSGNPISLAFNLDIHATLGDGARYQSRDRCFRDLTEDDYDTLWADWIIYQSFRSIQAGRVQDGEVPDLFVNYFRSRWKPHWHSWLSTLSATSYGGIPTVSIVCESNKVFQPVVDSDPETYKSACTLNFDYIITSALVMQGGFYEKKSMVLIEHEVGNNQVNNSEFEQWQKTTDPLDPQEYRPGYWTPRRSSLLESYNAEKHMNVRGRPLYYLPELEVYVPAGSNVGPLDNHDIQVTMDVDPANYRCFIVSTSDTAGFQISYWTTSGNMVGMFTDTVSSNLHQCRFCGADDDIMHMCLLGNSLGDNLELIKWELLAGVWTRSSIVSHTTEKIDAATAYDGSQKLYVIGGEDSLSVKSRTVLEVDSSSGTITELGTNLLTTANSGASAVFCSGGTLDGFIACIGGKTISTNNIRIVLIDPVVPSQSETLLSVVGSTLPDDLSKSSIVYDGIDTIWIYGGESDSLNVLYGKIWTLTYDGANWAIEEKEVVQGFDDDADPEDYSGESIWKEKWSHWRGVRTVNPEDGAVETYLLGGKHHYEDESLDPGPYAGMYMHIPSDNLIARPQDYTFGYLRYNLHLDALTYRHASTSWSVKADNSAVAAYCRINNAPGSSGTGTITTRRARTYYMHPPKTFWIREQGSLNLDVGQPEYNQDEWRLYLRGYRHEQGLYLDSPMVQTDTLWASSWSPYGFNRAVENAYWSYAGDPRFLKIEFTWLPYCCFTALTSSTKLLVLGNPALEPRIELWAIVDDVDQREFFKGSVVNQAEPYLQLKVYHGEGAPGAYEVKNISVYWGGLFKDTAISRFDSSVVITIWQHVKYGRGIVVNNFGSIGCGIIKGAVDSSVWGNTIDLTIFAGGWWAEPEIFIFTKDWIKQYCIDENINGALLLGDRDPTFGQSTERGTFRYTEKFDRSDSTNLGDNWYVISQTGNGWNIYSQEAKCSELGWERWSAYPYIRDVSIFGDFRIPQISSRVGLFSRFNWYSASDYKIWGYLGSLYVDGSGDSYLQIELFDYLGGVQNRSVLVQKLVTYTLNSNIQLEFEVIDDQLTLYLRSGAVLIDSINVSDSTYGFPGSFGLCGETSSSSKYVYADNIFVEARGGVKIRISD